MGGERYPTQPDQTMKNECPESKDGAQPSEAMTSVPRKGGRNARIKIYCTLLLMYALVVMEMGRKVVSRTGYARTSGIDSPTTEAGDRTRPGGVSKRRVLRGEGDSRRSGGTSSDFLDHFKDILLSGSDPNFAALILRDEKVYCRKGQMKKLSRGRYFVQMLRRGLVSSESQQWRGSLPILMKHDDSNGCYPGTMRDKYGFPRLTWSVPVNYNATTAAGVHYHTAQRLLPREDDEGDGSLGETPWCAAVGMPSYKAWRDLNNGKYGNSKLEHVRMNMSSYEQLYPWGEKLPKAVWRGSTTANKGMYGQLSLQEIPRSQLVLASLDNPHLIDAGFHKLVGKYEGASVKERRRLMKDAIPLEEMMKYKGKLAVCRCFLACQLVVNLPDKIFAAIIDIDGNNWSARFQSLLCSNSLVIKVAPDFIEQYYRELEPNIHYIPASLKNLTQVVRHVLDRTNDNEMRRVVDNANEWCRRSMNEKAFGLRAMEALERYRTALERFHGGALEEWEAMRSAIGSEKMNDLVECIV